VIVTDDSHAKRMCPGVALVFGGPLVAWGGYELHNEGVRTMESVLARRKPVVPTNGGLFGAAAGLLGSYKLQDRLIVSHFNVSACFKAVSYTDTSR
jgi:hypothetical protein